jgi:hypothetical protein
VGDAPRLNSPLQGAYDRFLADDLAETPGPPLAVERRVLHPMKVMIGELTQLVYRRTLAFTTGEKPGP